MNCSKLHRNNGVYTPKVFVPPVEYSSEFTSVSSTFAKGQVVNTSTNVNSNAAIVTTGLEGASIVAQGTNNDNREYVITFNQPHPQGANYVPHVHGISNEPNGDEVKVNVVENSITANGFRVITTLDDNGQSSDQQVFLNFTFEVFVEKQVVENIIEI